jgi:hypothetical protein
VHTAYLDDILAARKGKPFIEPDDETQEIALIAAAIENVLAPAGAGLRADDDPPAASRQWKNQARAEGLR